jgi:monofunctional glycosyltransferase
MKLRRLAALFLAGLLALCGLVWLTLPDVSSLRAENPTTTAFIQARGDRPELQWVPVASQSPLLACAMIKAEDRAFHRHHGFDWPQLKKAAARAWTGHGSMGGSTITQQLARNLFLDGERTLTRKIREALITRRLEARLDKARILDLYLNVIEWGSSVWGAAAAARHYFDKAPAALDAFESTFLASLVAAPRQPLAGLNHARAARLQTRVLHQLFFSGLIDVAEWQRASARSATVFAALARGEPLAAALRLEVPLAFSKGRVPSRSRAAPLPLSRALAEDCGLSRELEETETFRSQRLPAR